jgi:hypothetical protein
MRRLKLTEVATTRSTLAQQQGQVCALCRLPMRADQMVLDHDHNTGAIRAVLHRGCNSLLGKVENNYRRYGLTSGTLPAFLNGAAGYIQKHETPQLDLLHPTHKTPEEKRLIINKRARLAWAKKAK